MDEEKVFASLIKRPGIGDSVEVLKDMVHDSVIDLRN